MAEILNIRGGINRRLNPWDPLLQEYQQCVTMQNLRHKEEIVESIPGTIRYHDTSLGTDPITAIIPHYNDERDISKILVATGQHIYVRDDAQNTFRSLKSNLTKNQIFSHTERFNVTYIASESEDMMKYSGGEVIETVGGGATKPGKYRQVLFMKEVDRLFGIRNVTLPTQIGWSDLSQPEVWTATNIDRIKSTSGDQLEWGEVLYGKLILFMTNSIWIYFVQGNEESWRLEKAPTTVGCKAFKTVKRVGSEIWFLGGSPNERIGVYAFNGQTSRLLTDDIHPYMENINQDRIGEACADIKDGIYTLSFAYGEAQENNVSIDVDSTNVKPDGSPAIYGPHTFGFYSSAVLNRTYRNNEFLMGGENNGWVHRDGGTSFDSISGTGGNLIQHRFISSIHNDGAMDVWKRYHSVNIHFLPRSIQKAILRAYFSYGTYPDENDFRIQANHMKGLGFEYDVLERPVYGSPALAVHRTLLGQRARGTAIQVELVNDNLDTRLAFEGYDYKTTPIRRVRKAQNYAI